MITQTYQNLWNDSTLQTQINDGIRRHRQSEARVKITDPAGKPLPGIKVTATQHDTPFHFGANIFKLGDWPAAAQNEGFAAQFLRTFNGATVPFYWRTLEPVQGRPRFAADSVPIARRPPPDTVVAFCKKNSLRMHGHTLVWNFRKWSVPDWLPEDITVSGPLWEKRIREIGARYGGDIKRWDALNEARGGADATGYQPPFAHPMPADYERLAFAWAERHLPADARLDINEVTGAWFGAKKNYTGLIRRLLDSGAKLGAIGLQFHLFADSELKQVADGERFLPEQLLAALDHYAQFNLPVHVSEITLTSPGNTPAGLDTQAEIARNFYRLWFSHPATEGITWWNFADGGAAPGEDKVYSGLLFNDMTSKPAHLALRDLIHREWRTTVSGETDANGEFKFRGFHGNYQLKLSTGMETALHLEPNKPTEHKIIENL